MHIAVAVAVSVAVEKESEPRAICFRDIFVHTRAHAVFHFKCSYYTRPSAHILPWRRMQPEHHRHHRGGTAVAFLGAQQRHSVVQTTAMFYCRVCVCYFAFKLYRTETGWRFDVRRLLTLIHALADDDIFCVEPPRRPHEDAHASTLITSPSPASRWQQSATQNATAQRVSTTLPQTYRRVPNPIMING